MCFTKKAHTSLTIMDGYIPHINKLLKPKNQDRFFLSHTIPFFRLEQTNTFFVAIRARSNNYNPWWQQTKQLNVRAGCDEVN